MQTAVALVHRPPVLLLDEPTVGADPVTRDALLAAVRQRAADGAAVCYTTHYLPELERLGASIAMVAGGRVIARNSGDRLLAGLPSELRVRFTGGVPARLGELPATTVDDTELRISTVTPGPELAALVAEYGADRLSSVVIRPPTLDDLYRRLALGGDHVG